MSMFYIRNLNTESNIRFLVLIMLNRLIANFSVLYTEQISGFFFFPSPKGKIRQRFTTAFHLEIVEYIKCFNVP